MTEDEFNEIVAKLEENKATCGVYKADRTLCKNPVEDLIIDGQSGLIPLCLEHSKGLESGKAYMIHTLSGLDVAIQLNTGTSEAILSEVANDAPEPPAN